MRRAVRPLKRVYSSFDLAAVHHAKNVLQAEGLRAVVKNEMLSSAMGELPPAECQAEVWVLRDEDAEAAERLLRAYHSAVPKGPPWTCARCGERSEAQFTQCWRCGAYREAEKSA